MNGLNLIKIKGRRMPKTIPRGFNIGMDLSSIPFNLLAAPERLADIMVVIISNVHVYSIKSIKSPSL
jgi:hypothetical protein